MAFFIAQITLTVKNELYILLKTHREVAMKEFTASDLQKNIGSVLSEAQRIGWVKIKSRSRPDMVLVTQQHLDELLK
ncbi:MAG: hypothetical protein R3204_17115, partial [Oceanospirillum sp.]|nr:hypothetical protein [Oceanospirillum sp.]